MVNLIRRLRACVTHERMPMAGGRVGVGVAVCIDAHDDDKHSTTAAAALFVSYVSNRNRATQKAGLL